MSSADIHADERSRLPTAFTARVWRSTLVVATTALVLLLFWFAAQSLLLIFAGVLFAVVLHRLAAWIAAHSRITHGQAVAGVFAATLALTGVLGWLLGSAIASQAASLTTQLPAVAARVAARLPGGASLQHVLQNQGSSNVHIAPKDVLSGAGDVVMTSFDGAVAIIVLVFLAIYGAFDPESYMRGLLRLVPPAKRERVRAIVGEIADGLFRWMVSRLAAMTVVGVVVWLGLTLLHVPLPIALGFVAGVLTFVPYLGAVISAVPACLLAIAQGPLTVLWVVVLFTIAHVLEGYLLTPLLTRHSVRFPPAFTLAVQVLLGGLYGIIGLALATPVAVVLVVLVQRLYVEATLGDAGARDVQPTSP
jgi:predicted PurR-regulated permease PerM